MAGPDNTDTENTVPAVVYWFDEANPSVLIAIVIGSVGGLIIGAVPGIGPAIALAILLPATMFLKMCRLSMVEQWM